MQFDKSSHNFQGENILCFAKLKKYLVTMDINLLYNKKPQNIMSLLSLLLAP